MSDLSYKNTEFTQATSFSQALKICRELVEQGDRPEVAPRLSDQAVKNAILTGIQSYEGIQMELALKRIGR